MARTFADAGPIKGESEKMLDVFNADSEEVKGLDIKKAVVEETTAQTEEGTKETVPYNIPSFPYYTNEIASLRVLAEALHRADYLLLCADNSNRKNYIAPDYSPTPIGTVFLTSSKAMQDYNTLLTGLHEDFWVSDFVDALYSRLDYTQVCGCQIPAVRALQARVNRHLGLKRKEYSLLIDHIRDTEPYSKSKSSKISEMIQHLEIINNSCGDILTEYEDATYANTNDDGTWSIGGCVHAYILAELLNRPNASPNVLMQEFIKSNRNTITASYVQYRVATAFHGLSKGDLQRWYRLLSLVGYGREAPLRGDVVGLTFGMVRLEKHLHSRRASAWYKARLDSSSMFEASCALCGKPFRTRIKWGDLQTGRIFSCGCTAPRTMYQPALERFKSLAVGRYHAKKSECMTSDKFFKFASLDNFLESVGLPWSKDCLDLSRLNDHKYVDVPYAPGYTFWECSSSNRARGAKAARKRRGNMPTQGEKEILGCDIAEIQPYAYAPLLWEKPSLESLRNHVWLGEGTTDRNPEIKSLIKLDTCKIPILAPRGGTSQVISAV